MMKLEYDGTTVKVPENWAEVTLGTYEKIYKLKPDTASDAVEIVAALCEIEPALLFSWPAEVFNAIVSRVMFIYGDSEAQPSPELTTGGVTYRVPVEDQITLGAWIDTDEAQKVGVAELSNVLAINCRPVGEAYDYKNNEARQKMFAALSMAEVLPVMGFFLQCKRASDRLTRTYGALLELADLLPRNTAVLRSLGAGIKLFQIWRVMKFCILNALLRYRLQRFSRSYSTKKIKTLPKTRKGN